MIYTLRLHIDHFSFYITDSLWDGEPNLWDEPVFEHLLGLEPQAISVGTARFVGQTTITLEFPTTPPQESFEPWDYVIECSLGVPSRGIIVYSAETEPGAEIRIPVEEQVYRVRIYYGGRDTVVDDIGGIGDDFYRVVFWPEQPIEPILLKEV